VSEYGVLGLCNTVLLFGCAASKLGLQNSIVRFYPEYKKEQKLSSFYSTFWLAGSGAAFLVTLVLLPLIMFFAPAGYYYAFFAVTLMVFGSSVLSNVSNFLRSEEKNSVNAALNVAFRYVGTFGGIALVYWFGTGISGLFWSQILVITIIAVWYFFSHHKQHVLSCNAVSGDLFKESLQYGLPLIAFEFSNIALAFSDRFLITHYVGAEQLGIYIAGYTICFYIADLIKQPLQQAIMPIYLRIYTEQGAEKTSEFLQDIMGYVFLIIAPVFAGVIAIKTELITTLSSSKYADASAIIPWVLAGTLLYGCQPLVAAGFYIKKQTGIFSVILVVGAALNIILNLLLIPGYGIIAAAWSTAISYISVLFVMMFISNKSLPLRIPIKRILFYSVCSLVMYLLLDKAGALVFPLKIALGVVVYSTLVLIFDRKVSREIGSLMYGRAKRWGVFK
jgi:O-antigen/teichoic acid export membrane protein